MEKISKIAVNGITYEIKDIVARNNYADLVLDVNDIASDVEDLQNTTQKSKGFFYRLEELEAAHPNPDVGDWALVGNENPPTVYVCNARGSWQENGTASEIDALDWEKFILLQDSKVALDEATEDLKDATKVAKSVPPMIQDKSDLLVDWGEVLEHREYSYERNDLFTLNYRDTQDPLVGKVLTQTRTDTSAGNTHSNLRIVFPYTPNPSLSFWFGQRGNANNRARRLDFSCINTTIVNIPSGTEVILFRIEIPTQTQLDGIVKTTIDAGQPYSLNDKVGPIIIYISSSTKTCEYYSASIDAYREVDGVTYWHIRLEIGGLYHSNYIALTQTYPQAWNTDETLLIGNLQIRAQEPSISSKYLVEQDPYSLPTRAYRCDVLNYSKTHDKDNEVIDLFNDCGKIYAMDTTNYQSWKQLSLPATSWHRLVTDYPIEKVETSVVNPHNGKAMTMVGYRFNPISGTTLPFYQSSSVRNVIFGIYPQNIYASDEHEYTLQFWVDVNEFNGNSLARIFGYNFGRYALGSLQEGAEVSCVNSPDYEYGNYQVLMKCVARHGNLICLRHYFTPSATDKNFHFSLVQIFNGEPMQHLTIYNPVMLEDCTEIDPYYRYESYAEKHSPHTLGKKILYIGDSQYNNGEVGVAMARYLGANVYDGHYGGHAMRYNNGTVNPISKSWFYQVDYRKLILGVKNVDAYVLTMSSNDQGGGGDISAEAMNEVLAKYPTYEDFGTEEETRKMSIFNALTDAQRKAIFTFAPVYLAYVRQMLQANPYAKFYICSVPISCGGYLTGNAVPAPSSISEEIGEWRSGKNADVAREELEPKWAYQRQQTIEIAEWYGAKFVDFKNRCGLTYDNFIYHCQDGTHWHRDISRQLGKEICNDIV